MYCSFRQYWKGFEGQFTCSGILIQSGQTKVHSRGDGVTGMFVLILKIDELPFTQKVLLYIKTIFQLPLFIRIFPVRQMGWFLKSFILADFRG